MVLSYIELIQQPEMEMLKDHLMKYIVTVLVEHSQIMVHLNLRLTVQIMDIHN